MPTDPFVAPGLDTTPRQEPNLAPGVKLPASRAWKVGRPGDATGPEAAGASASARFGRPGPNVGYALRLVDLRRDALAPAEHEEGHDMVSVVAELAMRRAASFGRAPTVRDVDVAGRLLGYSGSGASPEYV